MMGQVSRSTLKKYFERGDQPTESQFEDLIDTTFNDLVNVKSYGASGNGINDDTSAIQAALDHSQANSRKAVYLPAGNYNVTDTLEFYSKVKIFGDGEFSNIQSSISTAIPVIQANASGFENVVFNDFKITCSGSESKGLYLAEGSEGNSFNRLIIDANGATSGIHITDCFHIVFNDLDILKGGSQNILFDDSIGISTIIALNNMKCRVSSGYGINGTDASQLIINQSVIESNDDAGLKLSRSRNLSVKDSWFENNARGASPTDPYDIYLTSVTGSVANIAIKDVYFNSASATRSIATTAGVRGYIKNLRSDNSVSTPFLLSNSGGSNAIYCYATNKSDIEVDSGSEKYVIIDGVSEVDLGAGGTPDATTFPKEGVIIIQTNDDVSGGSSFLITDNSVAGGYLVLSS